MGHSIWNSRGRRPSGAWVLRLPRKRRLLTYLCDLSTPWYQHLWALWGYDLHSNSWQPELPWSSFHGGYSPADMLFHWGERSEYRISTEFGWSCEDFITWSFWSTFIWIGEIGAEDKLEKGPGGRWNIQYIE